MGTDGLPGDGQVADDGAEFHELGAGAEDERQHAGDPVGDAPKKPTYKKRVNPLSNPADRALAKSRIQSLRKTEDWQKLRARQAMSKVPMTAPIKFGVHPPVKRIPRTTALEDTEHGPLTAGMKRFALWMAQQDTVPTLKTQTNFLAKFMKKKVPRKALRALVCRVDFQAYYQAVQQDILARARAEYEELYPLMLTAQRKALEEAAETGNVRPVSKLITEGMDRLIPKKREDAPLAREFHIHLAPGQDAGKLLGSGEETVVELPEIVE